MGFFNTIKAELLSKRVLCAIERCIRNAALHHYNDVSIEDLLHTEIIRCFKSKHYPFKHGTNIIFEFEKTVSPRLGSNYEW